MGLFRNIINRVCRSQIRKNSRFLRHGLQFESLEDRSLLSAVPSGWSLDSVDGLIDMSTSPTIILSLDAQPNEEIILGIDIAAHESSTLKPGDITVYSFDPETGVETDVTDKVTYLDFGDRFSQESLIYAKLKSGEYHLTITPQDESEGAFTASVFLVGDSDGSGRVDQSDHELLAARISAIQIHNRGVYSQPTIKLYQSRYGIDITRSADHIYSSSYDFNIDGVLNGEDVELLNENLGVSATVDLEIRTTPTPEINPLPYTIPDVLDSDDLTPVKLNIPTAVTVLCEGSTVDSFAVADQESMIPSLSLVTADGKVYSTKEELISYWGITENDFDIFLSALAAQTTLADNIWTFQNVEGLFELLDEGDHLSTSYTYTINSFVYEDVSYKTLRYGTLTLNILGTEEHSDPVGPSSHTASFNVGTGQLVFDLTAPTLNVLDGVVDPLGYEMSATLVSVTPVDPKYPISSDAISISSNGTVEIVPEILAEDFDDLKRGETATTTIAYRITDTHSGKLDGTITLTVTGGNHAPTGETSHTADFSVSAGTIIFDELYVSLNLLDGVTDPDGDTLNAEMTGIVQPVGYTVSPDAISIDKNGTVQFNTAQLQSDFAGLPIGETVLFTVNFTIDDSYGGVLDGSIVVTVAEGSEGPQGVTDHTSIVNLKNSTVTYDGGNASLNLLDGVTDAQGLPLSVIITDIDAGAYTLPIGAITQTNGVVSVNIEDFQETFKSLALDETSEVLVTFAVSNTEGDTVLAELVTTVIGKYVAPREEESLFGDFNICTGILEFSSGEASPDILYGIVNPSGNEISGQLTSIQSPDGYTVSEGAILLVNAEDGTQRLFVNTELLADDFDLLPLGESANIKINLLLTDNCGSTLSRTVTLTVTGAYDPIPEGDVTISLIATVDPTAEGVTVLKTGTTNFGTFYYLPAENVPATDYQSVAAVDEYYLEVWVNDSNYSRSGQKKFISSIQLQLNYDFVASSPVRSVEIEDIYAGKYAIDEYLYYDAAENYLKALQVGWVFSDDLDWSRLDPITNGENAYLLARFHVILDQPYAPGFSTTITGVTEPDSPFVDGWYYVRTGETTPIDDSEIITVNVEF